MPDKVEEKDDKKGYESPYEIVEEGAEAPEGDKSEKAADKGKPADYADDERLSASQREDADDDHDDGEKVEADKGSETAEEIEAKRERRRRERKAQKMRQQQARERDAREMHFLRTRNEQLERKYGSLEERVTQNEVMQVEGRLEQLKAARSEAEEVLGRAIEANNGADVVKLNRTIRELDAGIGRLQAYRAELAKEKKAEEREEAPQEEGTEQADRRPALPRGVVKNLQTFAQRHPWFDPTTGDEDTRIVLALDEAVKSDGFDPATKEYWVELEERMARRLPERMKAFRNGSGRTEDDDDEVDDPPQRRNGSNGAGKPKAGGPRMTSGSQTRGSGKQFLLSAARKQALIEAGVWDDPVLRDKYIASFVQYDKEHPEANK